MKECYKSKNGRIYDNKKDRIEADKKFDNDKMEAENRSKDIETERAAIKKLEQELASHRRKLNELEDKDKVAYILPLWDWFLSL